LRHPQSPDSRAALEEIFDLAPVGFVMTDAQDMIERANRTVLAWSGLTSQDLLGQRWSDVLLTTAGRIFAETHVLPLLRLHHQANNIAIDLRCAHGRRLPVLLSFVERVGVRGEPLGYLMTFVEAIDREQYQRGLLDAKHRAELAAERLRELATHLDRRVEARTLELQRANEDLDSFAHVVSHDLRAPLRTMSGFSRILVDDYGPHLDTRGRRLLSMIDNAANTLSELIDGLLRLSLTARGHMRITQCDLSAIAQRIREELQQEVPDRSVQWTIEPHMIVRADAGMIEAALRNLLGNAWKYTSKRQDGRIEFACDQVNGERVFRVSDNGAGFDMAHARHLFEPFQRMHGKDEFPGLGIGLATVRRIIQRHGGTLSATAAPNAGATFSFTLPTSGLESHPAEPGR
jgi:PAS domain S-box-containing protein